MKTSATAYARRTQTGSVSVLWRGFDIAEQDSSRRKGYHLDDDPAVYQRPHEIINSLPHVEHPYMLTICRYLQPVLIKMHGPEDPG